jgi:hypothetical protein
MKLEKILISRNCIITAFEVRKFGGVLVVYILADEMS